MLRFGSTLQLSWDWRAAGNFMFGGTGGALMMFLALRAGSGSLPLGVSLNALILVGLGLFLVWLEIGRPWRFINVFFHPQTSWMTREASVSVVLFATALSGILFGQSALIQLAGVAGLAFLFCQGQILKAAKGIPSWREPVIVPLIMATGLAEGAAVFLLWLAFGNDTPTWLPATLGALLIVRTFFWIGYLNRLHDSKAPKKTLEILDACNKPFLIIGNAFPLVLIVIAAAVPSIRPVFYLLAALLSLANGWYLKFTIVARAAQNQGYGIGKLQKGRPNPRPPVRRK